MSFLFQKKLKKVVLQKVFYLANKVDVFGNSKKIIIIKLELITTRMGFEPMRAEHIGLATLTARSSRLYILIEIRTLVSFFNLSITQKLPTKSTFKKLRIRTHSINKLSINKFNTTITFFYFNNFNNFKKDSNPSSIKST
jgi:hypothetical protein